MVGFRARAWWSIGGGIALVALGSAAVVVNEMAPTRWPELAIRWSPSIDHVLRARLAPYPAGPEPAQLRDDTARFSVGTVEASARRGGGFADRAATCLAARAFTCDSLTFPFRSLPGDPAALAALERLARCPDVLVRRAVYQHLEARPEVVGLVEQGLADGDPVVAASAAELAIAEREGRKERLAISPAGVERLVALIDATPSLHPIAEAPKRAAYHELAGYRELPMALPMRTSTPKEAASAAVRLQDAAWLALAVVAPARAQRLAEQRGLSRSRKVRIAEALGRSPDHLLWLRSLAADGDVEIAKKARWGIGRMAALSPGSIPAETGVEAYEALAAIGCLDSQAWDSLHLRAAHLWRKSGPELQARLERALPDWARAQLLADVGR